MLCTKVGGSLSLLSATCILGIFANIVGAEPLVYPDQFVVEFTDSQTTRQQGKDSLGLEVRPHKFGKTALVLSRQGQARYRNSTLAAAPITASNNENICPELVKSGLVISCSPNYVLHASVTPNDPLLAHLWGLNASQGIDAPAAWDLSTGSEEVVVAVVDTGVDYTHTELSPNIWTNPWEVPGNGIDDDRNGIIDDLHGANFIKKTGNPMDDNSHGTHVAGTIAAAGNNSNGVVGINWHSKVMALKFLAADGSGSLSDAIEALDYMVAMKEKGVNIVAANNSWGGGGYSQPLFDAITRVKHAGIVFVAAAGNEANNNDEIDSYPANYKVDNVLSVAAIDSTGNLASFSNYGAYSVQIAAPGVDIVSSVPGNKFASYSGTSMATPHVTGAIALVSAYDRSLNSADLIRRVLESGVTLPTLSGLLTSSRKLNVARMLINQIEPLPVEPPHSNGCAYDVIEVPFSPDRSADSLTPIQQADEGQYTRVELPFAFPFQAEVFNSIFISPNGVVYLRRAPGGMDYQSGDRAPIFSIAALHTDLTATRNPYGARVAVSDSAVTISWMAQSYANLNGPGVRIWLTLRSDGSIDDSLSILDNRTAGAIRAFSTVGLTGHDASSAVTYARNSSLIRNQMAVRFIPRCDDSAQGVRVSQIKLFGKKPGKGNPELRSKEPFQIDLQGEGNGRLALKARINNKTCPTVTVFDLNQGRAILSGKIPNFPNTVKKVGFEVTATLGQARMTYSKGHRDQRRTAIGSRLLNKLCRQLVHSVS